MAKDLYSSRSKFGVQTTLSKFFIESDTSRFKNIHEASIFFDPTSPFFVVQRFLFLCCHSVFNHSLKMYMRLYSLSICFTLSALMSSAQTDKIVPDRPGETLTPYTVNKKWIQFEASLSKSIETVYLWQKEKIYKHPSIVAKYGLINNLELRLITDYATEKFNAANGTFIVRGIDNVQAGVKYNFIKEKGLRPLVSLVAHYDFRRLRTFYKDSIDGTNFRFAMLHTISKALDLNYNIGMQWPRFGSPYQYIYTLSPKIHFNEDWHAFIEVYGFIENNNGPEHFIDGGLSYFINDRIMVDAAAGISIRQERPIKFFELGFSYAFNTGKK